MSQSSPPNILLIMSDQHGRNGLGCYGSPIARTPNLDRLAGEGMRFTNAYCPAPLCCPSRMSFLTSRTPSRNRVWGNDHVLHSGIPTFAHALGAAGYRTTLIGRMHFVGPDQRHGFEERPIGEFSAGHPGSPNPNGPRWERFPGSTSGQGRPAVEIAGRGTTHYQWFDDQVASATCDYLRQRAADADDRRPFAAVAGFVLPHCPFIAPHDLFDHYYDRVDIPEIEPDQPPTIRRFREVRGILDPPLPEERIRIARAAYFALCEYFDRRIGEVLETLAETGLDRNTLVIYCSDHGEMAGEHGCWWKSSYYENSVGVPLIARLPGVIEADSVCPAVCNLMDLGPTLADAAGAEPMRAVDGRSLWPTMRNAHPPDWRDVTFSELVDSRGGGLPSRMVRSGRWKLWQYVDDENLPPAMFDLENDPEERHDLGRDPDFADERRRLLELLHADWGPAWAQREARALSDDLGPLLRWGEAVQPRHPDTLTTLPADVDADVELL